MPGLTDDLFFQIGATVFLIHFVQYYFLLESISKKIKRRHKAEIIALHKNIGDLLQKKLYFWHRKVHKIDELYDQLDFKVQLNLHLGIAIIVLCALGAARIVIPSLSRISVFIGVVLGLLGVAYIAIFYQLLSWNLKK